MQECWNERTKSNEQGYYRDNSGRLYRGDHNGKAGTVIGAIIGGALGNQVGSGDGRKAATIAGAVIGGAVASKHNQRDDYDGYDYYDGDGGAVALPYRQRTDRQLRSSWLLGHLRLRWTIVQGVFDDTSGPHHPGNRRCASALNRANQTAGKSRPSFSPAPHGCRRGSSSNDGSNETSLYF
ncbi:MAG: glycine zipper 2TM domain-containing protein [Rhodanobacteraceae bacterium]|nr:glycine zipper 2TM domain-containing protein [Rhodanobacteraceae bacterium]